MLTIDNVSDFVYETCSKVSVSRNGTHFHARCPLCGDSKKSQSKKRFHIEYTDDNCRYNCFNCSRKGDFYGLYAEFKGMSRQEAWKKFHKYNSDQAKSRLNKKEHKDQPKISNDTTYFNWIKDDCLCINDKPNGYIQTKYYDVLKQFIDDRIINIVIYIAYKGKFKDRIIIPIYDGDDIVYFQGRTINDNDVKYLNPVADKQSIIFNKDNFIQGEPIYITEGIIDAQSIGNNATCCLGKEISDEFLDTLYEYTDDVYIVLDNDEDGIKSLEKLMKTSKYNQKLYYFLMPLSFSGYKDINMIVVDHKNIDIVKFVTQNSHSIGKTVSRLKWRRRTNEVDENWHGHNNSR